MTVVPARVPTDTYSAALDLVKGRGKPSWGQLVSWTCQDEPTAVVDAVAALAAAVAGPRRLRGQNREGGATTQVTARMTPEEWAAVEAIQTTASAGGQRDVTRTMVIIGALDVAVCQAQTDASGLSPR